MKKKLSLLILSALFLINGVSAQSTEQLQETAKAFMRQGDYSNSILVLNRALRQMPENTALAKDLALSYYYQKDNLKAIETIKPVLDSKDADDQCYQIAGNIYKQLDQYKECEKVYRKGLKKFPASGPLYCELGEIVFPDSKIEAIKSWEKGIETDPSYNKNYYNASRYYFYTGDKVWAIIYGEMYANMDPTGIKTPEIKQLILNSYKKLFTEQVTEKPGKDKAGFVKNYLEVMNKQSGLVAGGINAEILSMVRARFTLDWFSVKNRPAFKLFSYQQQLLKDGMFEAYNQWLFGATENLSAYENWVKTHPAEYEAFLALQKSRMYKVPADQYYH
jgi:tetratricopeptide (TPR) repeat protein